MVRNFKQRLLRHFTLLNLALGFPLLLCLYALGAFIPRTVIDMANLTTAAHVAETLSTNLALGRINLNAAYSIQGHQLQTQPVFFPIASKARDAIIRRTANDGIKQLFENHIATDIQLILSPKPTVFDGVSPTFGTVVAAINSGQIGDSFQFSDYRDENIHPKMTTSLTGQRHNETLNHRSAFAPVYNAQGQPVAIVVVHSDAALVTRFNIYSGLIALLLVTVVFGLSIYFATQIANRLHHPIKSLHDGMLAFSEGDFSVHLPSPRTGDEMDGLIQHFNNTSEQLRERLQMLQAMEMAADIQTKLLPTDLPEVHRYDLAVSLQYAELAGGDYYDFIPIATGKSAGSQWLMVVGDVTGHGVSAALLVAWLRATVRALARECQDDLLTLTEKLNASMLQDMNTGKFVTLFFAVLDSHHPQVTWLSAGHDPARLYRDENPPQLLEACGPPVGVITTAQWERPAPISVDAKDRLLVVTDGLQDAKNNDNKRLGIEPVDTIMQHAAANSAKTIKHKLVSGLAQHIHDTPLVDDVTFLVIKRDE